MHRRYGPSWRRAGRSFRPRATPRSSSRGFEHVYFARPDGLVNSKSVYRVRERLGRRLAQEAPVAADVVIPVPDSGVPSAIGYANEAKIPFEMGMIRSHYVGRTFIE